MKLTRPQVARTLAGAALSCALVACGTATGPTSTSEGPTPDVTASSASESLSGSASATPTDAAIASVGVPRSLIIESIGVSAPIIPLGTAADGAQEVPTSVKDVGWWKHGSEPAGAGSTVLVGHAYSRGDGVFDDLEQLRKGDTITVTGTKGTAEFLVEETTTVPVEQFADVADDIYRTTGEPQLVVMTCGDYDGSDYQSTVIVRSRLVSTRS